MNGEFHEFVLGVTAKGVDSGVVKWVIHNTLRWFGHVMRLSKDNMVKIVLGEDSWRWCWEKTTSELDQ